MSEHLTVLVRETIKALEPHSNGCYLDATFGGGGHSRAILEASQPNGQVTGIDRDPEVTKWAEDLAANYPNRLRFEVMSFDQAQDLGMTFDGIVADLGMSSDQLHDENRGFGFSTHGELDLRFDSRKGQTAAQFLSSASQDKIATVFQNYAQDKQSKYLASKIVTKRRERPIKTTEDFITIVGTNQPKVLAPLFQALRIQVNDELNVLKRGLQVLTECLNPNGRIVVISFHSLEDAIVKEFFRSSDLLEIVTKKPITPASEEINNNSRCRSAKMRVAKRLVRGENDHK